MKQSKFPKGISPLKSSKHTLQRQEIIFDISIYREGLVVERYFIFEVLIDLWIFFVRVRRWAIVELFLILLDEYLLSSLLYFSDQGFS